MTLAHETEPLLANAVRDVPQSRSLNSKKLVVSIICAIMILATDFGFFMAQAPQTAIFEEIICRNHGLRSRGSNATIDGVDPCKSEPVQGELALILGWKDTFDVLPGILLSLPFGILSDHWGRKPVLKLSVLGLALSETWLRVVCYFSNVMPLRMVWLSGLWRMIGGGDQVTVNIALVMVADIFSEEERSNALLRLQSCVILAEILATPLSAYLMTFEPAIPYVLGLIIMLTGLLPVFFLPETLEDAKAKKPNQQRASTDATGTETDTGPTEPSDKAVLPELVRQLREFRESTRFIWRDWNICLMIAALFVSVMSRQSTNMLLQYSSKKFNWSIARASLLISLRGTFQLANYLVLVPGLSFLAARYFNLHGKQRDYRLSQGSGILSIIGFTAMGLAPVPVLLVCGLVILSLGSAFMISMRSLVTSLVLPDHVGTLYSAIGISQAIGMFVAGPLFAYLFKLGMHLGNAWMGMPFLQAALFYVVATIAVWRVRISRSTDEEQEPLVSE